MPALIAAGFRPLAVDTPGFGRSAYDGSGWSIRRVAAEMAGLLDELHSGPAHVVGLSMGGTIAQQLALDSPRLMRTLVLVSTFAVLRPNNLSGWMYFMQRLILVNTLGLPAQAKVVAQRVLPGPQNAQFREMLVDTISHADPRAYRKAMTSLGSLIRSNDWGRSKSPRWLSPVKTIPRWLPPGSGPWLKESPERAR